MCNFANFSTCWHVRSQTKLFFSRLVNFSPSNFSDTLGNNTIFVRFDLLLILIISSFFPFITLLAFLSCIKKCPNKNRPMSCEFLFTFFSSRYNWLAFKHLPSSGTLNYRCSKRKEKNLPTRSTPAGTEPEDTRKPREWRSADWRGRVLPSLRSGSWVHLVNLLNQFGTLWLFV